MYWIKAPVSNLHMGRSTPRPDAQGTDERSRRHHERRNLAGVGRRGFLAAGAGAFLCTIGGEKVLLAGRGDAAKADAAAARVKRPAFASATAPKAPIGSDPVDKLTFVTPGPQSGGVEREYWIQATSALWDIVPSRPRRDLWHGVAIPGPTVFRAVMYQEMTEGFAAPKGPAAIPGPILHCEVGDVLKVHFRNALPEKLNQAVTMHPHGVRYNPEYDGVYLGDFTRAGGFIAPGRGVHLHVGGAPRLRRRLALPRPRAQPHAQRDARAVRRPDRHARRAPRPPTSSRSSSSTCSRPPSTGLERAFQCINGRAYAGNTPTLRAKVGQDVALHVIGMDNNFHDFHIHGHRWRKDGNGIFTDVTSIGPNESTTARFVEDNPGRWLYHCHVFSHQDAGMTGYYIVEP